MLVKEITFFYIIDSILYASYHNGKNTMQKIKLTMIDYAFKDLEENSYIKASLLQAFSGRDASQAFISYHRRNFPHNRARPALEGIDDTVNYTQEDHTDFMELCERVNKVLPRLKSFAPWHYYIKCAYLICAFLFMEVYCHYNNFYNLPIAIIMGLHMAWIGEFRDRVKSISGVEESIFLRPQYSA